MDSIFDLIGQALTEWFFFAEPRNRWLQALQAFGCYLFLLLFIVMLLALTGLLERLASD